MSRFIQVMEAAAKDPFANMTKGKYGDLSKGYMIEFFGKSYKGELYVESPKDDYVITDKQRKMLADFEKNKARYSKQVFKALLAYINKLRDYKDYFDDQDIPKTEQDMGDIVKPKYIIIHREENLVMDCDAEWDPEHGVSIQIIPSVRCGGSGDFY